MNGSVLITGAPGRQAMGGAAMTKEVIVRKQMDESCL